jgi:hypothetical protein
MRSLFPATAKRCGISVPRARASRTETMALFSGASFCPPSAVRLRLGFAAKGKDFIEKGSKTMMVL